MPRSIPLAYLDGRIIGRSGRKDATTFCFRFSLYEEICIEGTQSLSEQVITRWCSLHRVRLSLSTSNAPTAVMIQIVKGKNCSIRRTASAFSLFSGSHNEQNGNNPRITKRKKNSVNVSSQNGTSPSRTSFCPNWINELIVFFKLLNEMQWRKLIAFVMNILSSIFNFSTVWSSSRKQPWPGH